MEAALALAHTDHEAAAAGVVVANDLTRRYGAGETAVDALRGRVARDPARPPHRRHGPLGLGQVDADAHPRRPRQAELRQRPDRRRRADDAAGQRPDEAAPPAHRLRLPVLQPAADADGGGERAPAALDRGREAEQGLDGGAARGHRPHRPALAPAVRALRRPAAARRRRPRARLEADGALRRRADRQPRLADLVRDPRPAPRRGRHLRPDDRDGHARSARGHDRRPDPLPRRRRHRQGAAAARRRRRSSTSWARCPVDEARRAPGPDGPQAPFDPDGDRDRPRRRDGERHARPHGHDRQGLRLDLLELLRADRRRHLRHEARRVVADRQGPDLAGRAPRRSGRCPRSRPPPGRSSTSPATRTRPRS